MTKFMAERVVVVGQGYVGLPLALAAASAGFEVVGIDIDHGRVNALNLGISHIEDVSNKEISKLNSLGRYRATEDFSEVSSASIVILAVPTPLDAKRAPDLSSLISAVRSVAIHLQPGSLLISESTSYPGTTRELLLPIVEEILGDKAANIDIACAPERVDPGNKEFDHRNTPRIVAGLTQSATTRAADFYRSFTESVIEVTSPEVAEAAKLLENTFRQVNIALVNEIAIISNKLGIDVREVIEAAATKPYGFMKFLPGAGVGGHCIPVDPSYLSWRAKSVGARARFIDLANEVNLEMPKYVVGRLVERIKASGRESGTVTILGVGYKSGVADVRETPATGVADALELAGFTVRWVDPLVAHWRGSKPNPSLDDVVGVIVVTAQPGLMLDSYLALQVPVLDCTGAFRQTLGVEQL
jgi:UDP-N-acetyl-D-glucosamine dehydrogenase